MSATFSSPDAAVVETTHGRVRGQQRNGGLAFRGIPYGADTAGPHRFLPPQPPSAWTGIRDCLQIGPRAPQITLPHLHGFEWLDDDRAWSEDCLVLNIDTPAADAQRRPVMVWLHGGGFAIGSGGSAVLDGGRLAQRGDAVVVTLNHRLNAFGFFAPVSGDERFADSGNAGMLDIVAALRWVRDNIAAFGGDPGCVTVFGQSGGGAKVAVLMAMEAARGLFHRAIVQSSSSGFRVQTLDDCARSAHALLQRFDLTPARLSALQLVAPARLLQEMVAVIGARHGADGFRPVIDGRTLHGHPFFPQAPAMSAHIPLLIGYAKTESSFFLLSDPDRSSIDGTRLQARVQRSMHIDAAQAAALIATYAAQRPEATAGGILVDIVTDHIYRLANVEGAEQQAAQGGAPVFMYEFAFTSPGYDGYLRSPHTIEIPFVFGRVDAAPVVVGASPGIDALMHQTMDAWLRFARVGDPNGPGLPAWPPFNREERATMVFDTPSTRLAFDPRGIERRAMATHPRFTPGAASIRSI